MPRNKSRPTLTEVITMGCVQSKISSSQDIDVTTASPRWWRPAAQRCHSLEERSLRRSSTSRPVRAGCAGHSSSGPATVGARVPTAPLLGPERHPVVRVGGCHPRQGVEGYAFHEHCTWRGTSRHTHCHRGHQSRADRPRRHHSWWSGGGPGWPRAGAAAAAE